MVWNYVLDGAQDLVGRIPKNMSDALLNGFGGNNCGPPPTRSSSSGRRITTSGLEVGGGFGGSRERTSFVLLDGDERRSTSGRRGGASSLLGSSFASCSRTSSSFTTSSTFSASSSSASVSSRRMPRSMRGIPIKPGSHCHPSTTSPATTFSSDPSEGERMRSTHQKTTRTSFASRSNPSKRALGSPRTATSFAGNGAICGVTGEGRMTCGIPVATDSVTGAPMIIEFAHTAGGPSPENSGGAGGGGSPGADDNKALLSGLSQVLDAVNDNRGS
ncbi:unnamed protein product [Amoebophrya sp. A25]|nr:unnamed protein product [Amoebophrya sp. A25]|eukprot:GSA25T00019391001.1